jgi:hypothetical protein
MPADKTKKEKIKEPKLVDVKLEVRTSTEITKNYQFTIVKVVSVTTTHKPMVKVETKEVEIMRRGFEKIEQALLVHNVLSDFIAHLNRAPLHSILRFEPPEEK